jgi:2-polyprenyl-6-hydroxyphenyl methylase / 3-demethylubiquinone-9 3-methyltransferase
LFLLSHVMNVDPAELEKFSALAHRWWDPTSEFKPLHEINPLRLGYIEAGAGGIQGKRVLDVGCGGGILSEAMAARGANVTGIDLADKPLKVAKLRLFESGLKVDYRMISAEELARTSDERFDVVTCMEMLEHVPDPGSVLQACAALLKPGGKLFVSTLNRTPVAFAAAIVGAEYIARLLPKGTHEYRSFIRPSELAGWLRDAGLRLDDVSGLAYDPVRRKAWVGKRTEVNYLACAEKE